MSNWKCHGVRNWVLGAAATGLICQSMPVFGQTRNSIFFKKKSSATKPAPVQTPAQTAEPPRLLAVPVGAALAVPVGATSAANSIQPTSQIIVVGGEKSEVQKQLEALYEQDGREMPPIITSVQPIAPNARKLQSATTATAPPATANPAARQGISLPASMPNSVRPIQGYTQYPPRPQATPYTLRPHTTSTRNFSAAIEAQSPQPQAQVQQQSQIQQQFHTQPQVQPPHQPQPSQNSVARFFRKITGSNQSPASLTPVPPDYVNTIPSVPPVSGSFSAIPPGTQVPGTFTAPPNGTPMMPLLNGQPAVLAISVPELPPPTVLMPPLSQQPTPLSVVATPVSIPPLMTEPLPQAVALKSVPDAEVTNIAVIVSGADFPNPFTEMTEAEADNKITTSPKTASAAIEIVETAPPVKLVTEPEVDAAVKPDEDPFAVTAKDFSEPVIDESVRSGAGEKTPAPETPAPETPPSVSAKPEIASPPALTAPSTDDAKPAVETIPTIAPPPFEPGGLVPTEVAQDPHLEKMRRIRDRFGMKGLKGFCPVTLHDERELIDARPEFHFTHRSQKFHFASAEARDKFETDPTHYAPAAYGADVVALSRDKDVVEGTLDFAAWFKGRLYLFGSQENYNTFVAAPSRFATLAGIE